MNQDKLIGIIKGLFDELDDEYKTQLLSDLNARLTVERPLVELEEYLKRARLPMIGEIVITKVAVRFMSTKSYLYDNWPAIYRDPECQVLMNEMESLFNRFPDVGDTTVMYQRWNGVTQQLLRIAMKPRL